MNKKIIVFGGMLLALLFVVSSVFAQNDVAPSLTTTATAPVANTAATNTAARAADVAAKATTKAADVAAKITCVKTAVATREATLATAVAAHSQAVAAAYSTRANELAGAYSNTTAKTLKAGVKVAWADFNKSIRAATKSWKDSRNVAWSAYRTAVKECRAASDISDASNSGSEV